MMMMMMMMMMMTISAAATMTAQMEAWTTTMAPLGETATKILAVATAELKIMVMQSVTMTTRTSAAGALPREENRKMGRTTRVLTKVCTSYLKRPWFD